MKGDKQDEETARKAAENTRTQGVFARNTPSRAMNFEGIAPLKDIEKDRTKAMFDRSKGSFSDKDTDFKGIAPLEDIERDRTKAMLEKFGQKGSVSDMSSDAGISSADVSPSSTPKNLKGTLKSGSKLGR